MLHRFSTHSPLFDFFALGILLLVQTGCSSPTLQTAPPEPDDPPKAVDETHLVFGSCIKQNQSQNFWEPILKRKPDGIILMGDNIYADTTEAEIFRKKYEELGNAPGFQKVKARMPIFATWDDHDYGEDDAGGTFAAKAVAKDEFLRFFEPEATSPRRLHPGIYRSFELNASEGRVQILLLDTRWFRSPLKRQPGHTGNPAFYAPLKDPHSTLLGAAQWKWLEQELKKPADIRILVSSIQLIAEKNPWEKWANFPLEKERLLQLIQTTGAKRLVVLSGDRHMAAFYRLQPPAVPYALYEVTSSGMNTSLPDNLKSHDLDSGQIKPSQYIENFGLVKIRWKLKQIELQIYHSNTGELMNEEKIPFQSLE